jgi:uncharacterized protein YcgL (UPF0745 family)
MQCFVYRCQRKAGTYVYLSVRDDGASLPASIKESLGPLVFVMELSLTAERKLATEDVERVRENLARSGFHIQFPPDLGGRARSIPKPTR